jgi:hypothetical protein
MSRGSRDGREPLDADKSGPTQPERRQYLRQPSDLSVRIVVEESSDSGSGTQVFRVYSGWQCDISSEGVGFICPTQLSCDEVFLELRSSDYGITFQAARIVHAQEAENGHWRYGASFILPESRIDRYEFD